MPSKHVVGLAHQRRTKSCKKHVTAAVAARHPKTNEKAKAEAGAKEKAKAGAPFHRRKKILEELAEPLAIRELPLDRFLRVQQL